ncbi:hypothetical protein K503DRAFT_870030 [Rhizopogon vinicolor AM-OR11-026]|uniref:TERF2-interacting telomeric protein 1 Myb domain-containing protein n=1 Tax=Rhizopogon vinicolor AM-OR11-026 TaxID=1314800 RepID=A0A1B7MJ76_9AGAM|nr:hypothetical protein K503DRAFT_870030 [Rhizopogon vinicolor AM-OR11-026]
MSSPRVRSEFSADEDVFLMKYIATYNPTKQGRSGNALYHRLEENVDRKWDWSQKHTWQSWRNRYTKNSDEFDRKILKYQKKKGINPEGKPTKKKPVFLPPDGQVEAARVRSKAARQGTKRTGEVSPEQRKVKRAKLGTGQTYGESSRLPLVEVEATSQIPAAGSSSKACSHLPVRPETVSDVPPLRQKPASTVNIPPLPSRLDTLPLPSSQPNSPVRTQSPPMPQLPPSSQPLASSSQQVVTPKPPSSGPKLVLKNKHISPLFRSLSPTPNHSTSSKRKKILPKVVEGHFTTLLTDRLGHIRSGGRSESEEEGTETWPPVRGKKGKGKDVNSSAIQEHPISQVETLTSRPALVPLKREPEDERLPAPLPLHHLEREHHPFSQLPYPLPPPPHPSHNGTSADAAESPLNHRSTNGMHKLVQNLPDNKPVSVTGSSTSDLQPAPPVVQPAAGPSKLTTAAVPSGSTLTAELSPKPAIVAPRASPTSEEDARLTNASTLARISAASTSNSATTIQQTRVPSKAESTPATDVHPVAQARMSNIQPLPKPSSLFLPSSKSKDKGKGKRRDAESPLTHAQRLLTRTQKQRRRQTVGGYEYDDIPSIDLRRAPSSASTSQLPRSSGSTSASVSRLPHRYSLPVQSKPSVVPAELSGYLTTLDLPGSAALPVPPAPITPADVPLATSVGFSTLISRIAAAHGFTPSVVLEVYKRVGSLKEAEKFVRGMRNVAEEWIGAKFEQREREARRAGKKSKRQNDSESSEESSGESGDDAPRGSWHEGSLQPDPLEHRTPNGLHVRYVSDESDYEPPPTSRAALWKRASMGGGDSLSASWGRSAARHYRTNEDEVAEGEDTADNDEGDDDGAASGEDDGESQDGVERAEEESVAEELIPEFPEDEDTVASNPEQDAEGEPKLASDHNAEHRNQDDYTKHHEFSQADAQYHASHIKRESPTPSRLRGDPEHVPVQNRAEVLDGDSLDVRRTCSVSLPWTADEDRAFLSEDWETLKMLERQRGKRGMTQRFVQLLR